MRSSKEWATSVVGSIGARAIWGIALVGLAVVGGCSSGQQPPPATEPAPGVVDLNSSGGRTGSDKTTVVVDNQNLNEMTIYAYQGTQRMRLGRAKATGTTELRIPTSLVSGLVQMRFYAEPMVTGGQCSYISEMIPVRPGDQVDFLIPFTR